MDNSTMNLAPILIFAYNRPEKLRGLLDSLKHCPEFEASPVFIFIDGPKSKDDAIKVRETERVARSFGPSHAQLTVREGNKGLKQSILAGVSLAMDKFDRAIILEDDLVVSPRILSYFNQALELYERQDRVWSISAYMYDAPAFRSRENAIFLPFANPWGWATWKNAWQKFEEKPCPNAPIKSKSFREGFDGHGVRDFSSILELDRQGLVSSWFINWYCTIFLNGGLTLFPPRPLVSNEGVASGTHASKFNFHRFLRRPPLSSVFEPKLPSEISVDFGAIDEIRKSRDVRIQKMISKLGALRRKASRKLRR